MNKIKSLILALFLTAVLLPLPLLGQTALSSTRLNEAVDDRETRIDVLSASGVSVGDIAFVDLEAMIVVEVDTTDNWIRVLRGQEGTVAEDHGNNEVIWIDKPGRFISKDLSGACTSATEYPAYTPLINVRNGHIFRCRSSLWELEAAISALRTPYTIPLRINVRNYYHTSGGVQGFQVKPGLSASGSGQLTGGEISPRFNDGFSGSSIVGLHVDIDLKGTTAVTTSGDVRGMQIELTTSDAGTRTISGGVTHMRFKAKFSATTITGKFTVFVFEKPAAQTNSQTYDAWADFRNTIPLVWHHDPTTEPSTGAGYIKVIVNSQVRYIALYSGAPTD